MFGLDFLVGVAAMSSGHATKTSVGVYILLYGLKKRVALSEICSISVQICTIPRLAFSSGLRRVIDRTSI